MNRIGRDVLLFAGFIVLSYITAALGGLATAQSVGDWYQTLEQPAWNPPDWVFSPVWTVLYTLMGISAGWAVAAGLRAGKPVAGAVTVFIVQLIANGLWSLLFFGLQNPLLALVEIVVLWGLIVATIAVFYPLQRFAAALLLPYLLWVSFAAVLNGAIVWLN